jgi:gluconate 2-dehydrogenase gamma chain
LSTDAQAAAAATAFPDTPESAYASLSPEEAAFTETMVNALCPADHLTPNGVACGLATVIDRKLAGDFGRGCAGAAWEHAGPGPVTHLPLTQEQFFKAGIAAINAACRKQFNVRFDQLPAADARRFLHQIAAGDVTDSDLPLASWFNDLVDPLLVQACFVGSVYDAYDNRVFWKLFGHAGDPILRS